MENLNKKIEQIEHLVQQDEGKRGIKDIIPDKSQLNNICEIILERNKFCIITGFPCCFKDDKITPVQETDGPLGAFHLGFLITNLDKKNCVDIYVDEITIDSMNTIKEKLDFLDQKRIQIKSIKSFFESNDQNYECIITIERIGRNLQGQSKTMKNRCLDDIISPLHLIVEKQNKNCKIISIGDGGNEFGMGLVYDKIVNSKQIQFATEIACKDSCDYLIVCSVSNWASYAIAAALYIIKNNLQIEQLFLSDEQENLIIQFMIEEDFRDGITNKREIMVDGFPLQFSLDKKKEIIQFCQQK